MTVLLRLRLRWLISALARPASRSERQHGWNDQIKQRAHHYFENLYDALRKREPLPPLGIIRSLDVDGVSGGALLERIARIMNRLRRYEK